MKRPTKIKFLTVGEKMKNIRKKLGMKQYDLEEIGITRSYISMIEANKRKTNKETMKKMIELFKQKALELNIELNINEEKLLETSEEQAVKFCLEKLNDNEEVLNVEEIIEVAKLYQLNEILAKTYIIKANILYDDRDYGLAFNYYYNTLDMYNKLKIRHKNSYLYNKLGKCKFSLMDYSEALIYFKKAYDYSILEDNEATLKHSYYNIALSYKKISEFDLALEYTNKYLELCDMNINFTEYVYAIILKSNCYIEKKETKLAIELYEKIIDKFSDKENYLIGFVFNNLGTVYLDLEESDKTLCYFNKAEKIRKLVDKPHLAHTLIDKSNIFLKKQQYTEMIPLLLKGIESAKKYKDTEYVLKGYYNLEKIYKENKEIEKLKEIYIDLLDYLENVENKEEKFNVYIKLSLIYLEENNIDSAKEVLLRTNAKCN